MRIRGKMQEARCGIPYVDSVIDMLSQIGDGGGTTRRTCSAKRMRARVGNEDREGF